MAKYSAKTVTKRRGRQINSTKGKRLRRRKTKKSYSKKTRGKKRTNYRRKRRTQRGKGFSHLKDALMARGMESANRIGKHIFNRKLGETFLVPGLRPKYSTPLELVENEIRQAVQEFKSRPMHHLKTAYKLLRK